MSYKSPISINYKFENAQKIMTDQELKVLAQVKAVIDVDKEELLQALKYDREQYKKGYADGFQDALAEFEGLLQDLKIRGEE